MKPKLLIVAAVTLFASLLNPASASTITWTLSLTFEDGGSGSGSFTIDGSTLALSSLDITTTPGSSPVWTSTIHYTVPIPTTAPDAVHVPFTIPATASALELFLQNFGRLNVAAPSISVVAVEQNQNLTDGGYDVRDGVGTISTTISSVPSPIAGAGLPGLALACFSLIGWFRRWRSQMP